MKDQVNFLPINKRNKNKKKAFLKNKEIVFLILLSTLFILMYGVITILNDQSIAEINKIDKQIKNESDFQIPYENLLLENQVVIYRSQIVEEIKKKQRMPLEILIGIKQSILPEVTIINYQFSDEIVKLNGKTENQEAVIEFKNNILQTGLFEDLTIKKIEKVQSVEETKGKKDMMQNKINYWDFVFEIKCKGEK